TGTAVYLSALPPPSQLKVTSKGMSSTEAKKLEEIQKQLIAATEKNKLFYHVLPPEAVADNSDSPVSANDDVGLDHSDDLTELNLSSGSKETFVLEIDDAEDQDILSLILDPEQPKGFDLCSTEFYPGNLVLAKQLQMFSVVFRQTLSETPSNKELAEIFNKLIKVGMIYIAF
ncbi:C2 domain-containing protein 5-like, partial [Saccoglossus kowalevskii]